MRCVWLATRSGGRRVFPVDVDVNGHVPRRVDDDVAPSDVANEPTTRLLAGACGLNKVKIFTIFTMQKTQIHFNYEEK